MRLWGYITAVCLVASGGQNSSEISQSIVSTSVLPKQYLTMSAEMQEQSGNRKKSNTLLLIYINIALYATCFQIQRPLEPFLVEKLGLTGDSGGEYAKLQSFFSLMQTVGSLLAGYFFYQYESPYLLILQM